MRATFLSLSLLILLPVAAAAAAEPAPRPAKIVTALAAPAAEARLLPGRLDAARSSTLAFEVPGRVVRLHAQEGERVRAGELVAALDDHDFRLALERAEVRLRQVSADLERSQAMLEDGHASSADVERLRAERDLADVALRDARRRLAQTELRAPYDGVVTRRLVDPYTFVGAGQPAVRVQDLSTLHVHVSVPEAIVTAFRGGRVQAAKAHFGVAPGHEFPLQFLENTVEPDPSTQSYRVTLALPAPPSLELLPGMTAAVRLSLSQGGGTVVSVPLGAIATDPEGRTFVWVVAAEDGRVAPRPVVVGDLSRGYLPVLEGLSPGEQVVAAGVAHLRPGMRVRPLTTLR